MAYATDGYLIPYRTPKRNRCRKISERSKLVSSSPQRDSVRRSRWSQPVLSSYSICALHIALPPFIRISPGIFIVLVCWRCITECIYIVYFVCAFLLCECYVWIKKLWIKCKCVLHAGVWIVLKNSSCVISII